MRLPAAALLLALIGCADPATPAGPAPTDLAPAADVRPADASAVAEVIQAVAQAQAAVQTVIPPAPAQTAGVSDAAVQHIIRWEITSPAYYEKRLRSPIWPGGASGITWCIGYDGGHQTAPVIERDWTGHPAVDRLITTAGITGPKAKAALPAYLGITTRYPDCERVFRVATLPAYHYLARRTFANGWDLLPPDAQGSLTSTVYNRGAGMRGSRRDEMRFLRDVCVPAGDTTCMGRQYRAMCRIWRGTPNEAGLCGRYEATARLAEGSQ